MIVGFLLSGCGWNLVGPNSGSTDGGSPIARAQNGGQAYFTLTTCAPTTERARMVEEIILQLNQQGVIASAVGVGTQARVNLNLCASGGPPLAVPNPQQTRR